MLGIVYMTSAVNWIYVVFNCPWVLPVFACNVRARLCPFGILQCCMVLAPGQLLAFVVRLCTWLCVVHARRVALGAVTYLSFGSLNAGLCMGASRLHDVVDTIITCLDFSGRQAWYSYVLASYYHIGFTPFGASFCVALAWWHVHMCACMWTHNVFMCLYMFAQAIFLVTHLLLQIAFPVLGIWWTLQLVLILESCSALPVEWPNNWGFMQLTVCNDLAKHWAGSSYVEMIYGFTCELFETYWRTAAFWCHTLWKHWWIVSWRNVEFIVVSISCARSNS